MLSSLRVLSALVAAGTLASASFAWECKSGCKTVRLPGQRITIEAADPTVSVRSSNVRALNQPTVGTLYMPLVMPMVGIGALPTAPAATENRSMDDSLTRALEAEHHYQKAMSARAAFLAETNHRLSLARRLNSDPDSGTPSATPPAAQMDDGMRGRLEKLEMRLNSFETRMTSFEQKFLNVEQKVLNVQRMQTWQDDIMNKRVVPK